MDITKIISDLKEKGLSKDQILNGIEQMKKEQTIKDVDYNMAKDLLTKDIEENDERKKASQFFNYNLD